MKVSIVISENRFQTPTNNQYLCFLAANKNPTFKIGHCPFLLGLHTYKVASGLYFLSRYSSPSII